MTTNGRVPVTGPPQAGPGRALVLAEASRLARAGRFDEARRSLAGLGDGSPETSTDVEVLDLLARTHAQQGRLAEADRCWERAGALDPGYEPARVGRERIAELRTGRDGKVGRPGGGRVAALAVGGVLVVAAAAAAGAWAGPRLAPDGTGAGDLAGLRAEQQRTADEVAGLRAALRPDPATSELGDRLAGSPVVARAVPGGTVLTFPEGLFAGGDTLSAEGRAALADLGRRLGPLAGRLPVTVVGHVATTSDAPAGADERAADVDLGLARADAAARELAAAAGRPLLDFRMTSAGADAPPFPGDEDADRARNRTVTIMVGGGA